MRERLSVVIITKNEEAEIEECLASVSWADEIVVVDSQSTDRTVEIARKFTDRVESRPFDGFTDQKQFATDRATGPWILNVDADERVSAKLKDEILSVLDSPFPLDGYKIPRLTSYAGSFVRHGGWYPDRKLRLFRKERGKWAGGKVHEEMNVRGRVGGLKNPLIHHSFRTLSDHLRTIDHLTDLGARDLAERNAGSSLWDLLVRPPSTFVKMYLLRLGMLDGWRGLVIALLSACHTAVKYAKARQILEERRERERAG